jgi:hypothetical protein
LGLLPWQGTGGRDYQTGLEPGAITFGQKNIRIIHETFDLDNDPEFQRAYHLLAQATQIVFLGFGYDRTNLSRLRIDFERIDKDISGSCLGFTHNEREQLRSDCSRKITLGEVTQDALMFLRNHVSLI